MVINEMAVAREEQLRKNEEKKHIESISKAEAENLVDNIAKIARVVDNPGFLDRLQQKVVSRKFLVFLIATASFFIDKMDSQQWVYVALAYISIQGIADIYNKVKGN